MTCLYIVLACCLVQLTGLIQPREVLLLEDLMHEQSRNLLRGNTGLSAALHYSRSRPPLNVLPLFDSLTDEQVAVLTRPVARIAPRPQVREYHPAVAVYQ